MPKHGHGGGGGAATPYPPGLGQDWFSQHLFCKLDPHRPGFWLAMLVATALFFGLLAALQSLGSAARRRLTVVCTFLAGLFYLGAFFLPPGNQVRGQVVGTGGRTWEFKGETKWVRPKPAEDDKDGAKDAKKGPEPPPGPAQKHLEGQLVLKEPAKGEEPKPGVHFLPIEGVEQSKGVWKLSLVGETGETELVRSGAGYAVTIDGAAATLTLKTGAALNVVKAYETPLGDFMMVMGAFTIGLGLINLCMVHGGVLLRGARGWHNSAGFFVGFLVTAICGIWQMQLPDTQPGGPTPLPRFIYEVMFSGLLKPLQSTTFALLGFFIVSAAYRAFRIRNTEAALMTVIAFLVMMGQVPLGQALTNWIPDPGRFAWLRIEHITNWLLVTPNTAATRGILFGSVTGGFALSLRVWLSLERGSYFGKEF